MEISNQLLKPFIEKIESEWKDLYDEVSLNSSDEALQMKPVISQKIRQLERLRLAAFYQEQDVIRFQEFPTLREALRHLKLDLRSARRKWHCYLVSKIRTQKRQERAHDVASNAL